MVDSVSNIIMQKNFLRNMNNSKNEISRLQQQIGSGRAVDTYLDLTDTGRVEGVINLESKVNDIETYIKNNNIVSGRVDASDLALKTIVDKLNEYRSVMVQRRSAVGSQEEIRATVKQLGRTTLSIMRENLNTRYEGQFIFAGARIDQEPVDDIVNVSNYLNGEITSNYYRGDAVTRTSRASDSLIVDYGIKADEQGFQKAISAIHIIMDAESDESVVLAFDMMNEAISEVINIRNKIQNSATQISLSSEIHESVLTYFTKTLSDLTATKIEEASVMLANDTTILMGAFQAFSIVSHLNLAEYLR